LVGCKPDAAIQKAAVIGRGNKDPEPPPTAPQDLNVEAPPAPAVDPATVGTVRGVILFKGKAPAKVRIDTSMDPACGVGGGGPVYSEQYAVKDGKLANVFVYVKSGPPGVSNVPVSMQPVVLDQVHCQYVPHVVAVVIDVSQGPRGAAQVKQMMQPETMIPVRCNNHPWMNAFINVAPTPFFAVSDAAGGFELHGLPPGTYVIGAVHEKLGEQTITVNVSANSVQKADFSYAMK
jgi:hypothetical protein